MILLQPLWQIDRRIGSVEYYYSRPTRTDERRRMERDEACRKTHNFYVMRRGLCAGPVTLRVTYYVRQFQGGNSTRGFVCAAARATGATEGRAGLGRVVRAPLWRSSLLISLPCRQSVLPVCAFSRKRDRVPFLRIETSPSPSRFLILDLRGDLLESLFSSSSLLSSRILAVEIDRT